MPVYPVQPLGFMPVTSCSIVCACLFRNPFPFRFVCQPFVFLYSSFDYSFQLPHSLLLLNDSHSSSLAVLLWTLLCHALVIDQNALSEHSFRLYSMKKSPAFPHDQLIDMGILSGLRQRILTTGKDCSVSTLVRVRSSQLLCDISSRSAVDVYFSPWRLKCKSAQVLHGLCYPCHASYPFP